MALRDIIATIRGKSFGLDKNGNPVWNRVDGSQIVLEADLTTGAPKLRTTTSPRVGAAETLGVVALLPDGVGAVTRSSAFILGATGVAASRTSVNGAGDAVYQALYTFAVPGSLIGKNGRLTLVGALTATGSANTKAYCMKINGAIVSQELTSTAAPSTYDAHFELWNTGSETANEYIAGGVPNSSMTSLGTTTTAVDTTQTMTVTLEVKWTGAVSAETISLRHAHILIEPGA